MHSFVIRAESDRNYRDQCWSWVWSLAAVDHYCVPLLMLLLLLWKEVRYLDG